MKKKLLVGLVTGLFLVGMVGVASANLISGDFRTESDLPDYSTLGPLVYEHLGAIIDSGTELTDADFVENPSSWGGGVVFMDYDPTINILTLDSQDDWDFQTFDAWISNISFDNAEVISGISMLSNSLTDPIFNPTLSFTDTSIHISWDYRPDYFNFSKGIAQFQVETRNSAPVPEPATMLLFGTGLAGLVGMRRKKSRK